MKDLVANKIVIAERDNIAAVIEKGKVAEFYVHRGEIILGDVYLAQVENILPSIEAAFVNVGSDKMGFLHAQDVMGKGALQDKLKPKQKIVVQVVKEPVGHKGPRVTTEISLPGRFLVLVKTSWRWCYRKNRGRRSIRSRYPRRFGNSFRKME